MLIFKLYFSRTSGKFIQDIPKTHSSSYESLKQLKTGMRGHPAQKTHPLTCSHGFLVLHSNSCGVTLLCHPKTGSYGRLLLGAFVINEWVKRLCYRNK